MLQTAMKHVGQFKDCTRWITNVGNEHDQVLISVATTGVGPKLQPMAKGLVRSYEDAQVGGSDFVETL